MKSERAKKYESTKQVERFNIEVCTKKYERFKHKDSNTPVERPKNLECTKKAEDQFKRR